MRKVAVVLFAFLLTLALALPTSARPGQRAWVALDNGSGTGTVDEALVVTTTSGGGRIFVAGLMEGIDASDRVAVIAYGYDGSVAWRARYEPPASYEATYVGDIAVSADDREVIVTAPLIGPDKDPMAVVAFDAAGGHLDWSWLSTPASAYPEGLATAPGRVIVVGGAGRADTDWFVVALRPLTGQTVWTVRSDARLGETAPTAVGASNGRAFVTGSVATRTSSALRVVAYATRDGSIIWKDTFKRARSGTLARVTGDGSRVLVQAGWRMVGYGARDGARVRVERLRAAWSGQIRDVTLDRRGTKVFFTGNTERMGSSRSDMVTAGYDLRTGRRLWFSRFDGGGWDEGIDVAWVPSSPAQVVVTGGSESDSVFGWRTVSYRARTGAALWSDLYRGPLHEQGFPRALSASPAGTRVYVVGYTTTTRSDDFATVAYRTT